MQSKPRDSDNSGEPLVFSVSAFNWKSITTLVIFATAVALLISSQGDRGFSIYALSISGAIFLVVLVQMHVSKVSVYADHLKAGGGLYKVKIPLKQIESDRASILTGAEGSRPGWRLNGIGIPGYCQGWFSGPRSKKVFAVLTSRKNIVYVPTSTGFDLMLTPDDPESFLRALGKG